MSTVLDPMTASVTEAMAGEEWKTSLMENMETVSDKADEDDDFSGAYLTFGDTMTGRELKRIQAQDTEQKKIIQFSLSLGFFCSECGAELEAWYPDEGKAGGVQLGNVAAERRPVMISPCPHCNGHNIRLNEEWEYRPN